MTHVATGLSKSDVAYDGLRQLIDAGKLRDGERITELKASRLLNMNRGPVREAILRLQSEGLIHQRGAGTCRVVRYVEDQDPAELIARYELREQIEGGAARLAARNMAGHQIERLTELAQQVQQAVTKGDITRRADASRAYWDYLLANCGNALLADIWRSHQLDPPSPRSIELDQRIRSQLPRDEQRRSYLLKVTQAIARHDGDLAERIVKETLRTRTRIMRQVLLES